MADQRIFDDFVRTNSEPSRGEDSFTFLNRAASPYWQRVRAFVDEAFCSYPQKHAADLRGRFRDRRWSMHAGAWWELYLFTLASALGADIEVHPELAGVSTRPDFRLRIDNDSVLVEARHVAAGLVSDELLVGRDDWITGPLDALWHANFMVAVRIHSRGATQPKRAAVTAGVIDWLDGLDPGELYQGPVDEFPRRISHAGEWRFELEAIPINPEARDDRRRRLVGLYPASGGVDNTATALRAALKEKASKYGRPDGPFLIAPLLTSGFVDTEDVFSALFGSEVVSFPSGASRLANLNRRADGFWRSGRGFRGTRVSAVLLGVGIMPWTVAGGLPRLWLHPAASHPLSDSCGLPTASIEPDGRLVLTDGVRTGADIFGLEPHWPGPEPPFS